MVDLREFVTVFVTSVGKPVFAECMKKLNEQDCQFVGPIVIRNVAPMDAAFQMMLDQCKTPFYCQVDEDMVLKPDGIRRLYETIQPMADNVAIVAMPLWDTQADRTIIGCKIHRMAVVKCYPYQSATGCEIDQLTRMTKDGNTVQSILPATWFDKADPKIIGEHSVYGSETVYERYYNLASKYIQYPFLFWLGPFVRDIWKRSNLSQDDMLTLAGFAAGLTLPQQGEKNYQDKPPGYLPLRSIILGEPEQVLFNFTGVNSDLQLKTLDRVFRQFPNVTDYRFRTLPDIFQPKRWALVKKVLRKFRVAKRSVRIETTVFTHAALPVLLPYMQCALLTWMPDDWNSDTIRTNLASIAAAGKCGALDFKLQLPVGPETVFAAELVAPELASLGIEVAITHPAPPRRDFCTTGNAAGETLRKLQRTYPQWSIVDPLEDVYRCCDSPFRVLAFDDAGYSTGCKLGAVPFQKRHAVNGNGDPDPWFGVDLERLRVAMCSGNQLPEVCKICSMNRR